METHPTGDAVNALPENKFPLAQKGKPYYNKNVFQ